MFSRFRDTTDTSRINHTKSSGLFADHTVQAFQGIAQSAQLINQAELHSLLAVDDGAHIRGQLPGAHHQLQELFPVHPGVGGDKISNLLLYPLEIAEGLGRAHHQPRHPDRVDGHGGSGGDEGVLGADCQGDADGVPSPQNQGDGGLFHPGNHLRNGKARLDVAADGVQQEQQTVNFVALLNVGQQRQDVLVLGGLGVFRQDLVALHLADDGQGIDIAVFGAGQVRSQFRQPVSLLLFVVVHGDPPV